MYRARENFEINNVCLIPAPFYLLFIYMTLENSIRSSKITQLVKFVERNSPLFILTGAGCSTASGIPDYRDKQGDWKKHKPVQYQDFVDNELTRQRYWARSMLGWPHISNAVPSEVHYALAKLEQAGQIEYLVTQNVDGLHQQAGSSKVLDLHGNLEKVRCLDCAYYISRDVLQKQLLSANPQFEPTEIKLGPDGDALIETLDFSTYNIINCPLCHGSLKPELVFFGESVPAHRVSLAMQHLQDAGALLVIGSSLMVFSGYRFCRAAKLADKEICVVNNGKTRADEELDLKIDEDCNAVFTQLVETLGL